MLANHSSFLRNALLSDSAVSGISGLAFVLFSKAIAGFVGLSTSWIILALGLGFIIYSVELFLAARSEPVNTRIARFAVYANLVWVLASAVLIFANLVPFTTAGKWAMAIVADVVLVFAILQYVGLRRLAR
jgi:hypothetical protein